MKNREIIRDFFEKYNIGDLFSKDDFKLFKLKKFHQGETIVNAKDKVHHIYFIISGGVDIHSFLSSGRSIFINKLYPSEIFGDVEYFGDVPTLFDVVANSNTLVMRISFEVLEKTMNENFKLWKYLGMTSTRKLLKTNKAILLKEGFNLKNILALHIVQNNFSIHFDSLTILAEELNVSYRNLTRVIKYFADLNILSKGRKSIDTINREAIKKYSKEI